MDRAEIDLREKIADEIELLIKGFQPITGSDAEQDEIDALWRAVGVVRAPIWHKATCPCSKCNNYVIPKEA